MSPPRSDLSPTRPGLGPTRAGLGPTRAELGPTRAELGPTRAELGPTQPDLSSTRPDLTGACPGLIQPNRAPRQPLGALLQLLVLFGFWLALYCPGQAQPRRAALYDDTGSPSPSAWAAGLDALERAMAGQGFEVVRVTRSQLNQGTVNLAEFDLILIGGGLAYPGYTQLLEPAAKQRLREAVASGTGLVAVCAGAYFASSRCVYAGVSYDDEAGYDLDLYPGPARGPVPGLPVLPNYGLAAVRFLAHPATGDGGLRHLWYGSGPCFPDPPPDCEVLATYPDGSPAVLSCRHGQGRVVLWGAHAELAGPSTEPDNPSFFGRVAAWAARR